jgi:hypothetical protein
MGYGLLRYWSAQSLISLRSMPWSQLSRQSNQLSIRPQFQFFRLQVVEQDLRRELRQLEKRTQPVWES